MKSDVNNEYELAEEVKADEKADSQLVWAIKVKFCSENNTEDVGYGGIDVSEGTLGQQLAQVQNGKCKKLAWRGAEIREHFRLLFKNDGGILLKLFPMFTDKSVSVGCLFHIVIDSRSENSAHLMDCFVNMFWFLLPSIDPFVVSKDKDTKIPKL